MAPHNALFHQTVRACEQFFMKVPSWCLELSELITEFTLIDAARVRENDVLEVTHDLLNLRELWLQCGLTTKEDYDDEFENHLRTILSRRVIFLERIDYEDDTAEVLLEDNMHNCWLPLYSLHYIDNTILLRGKR